MTTKTSIWQRLWLVGWAPMGVVALHSGAAAIFGHQREYDPAFHFAGGAAGAYCLWRALQVFHTAFGRLAGFNPVLVVMTVMVTVTCVWEVAEFASDRVLGTHVQLGRADTAMDIALGIVGASCAVGLAALVNRSSRRPKSDAV